MVTPEPAASETSASQMSESELAAADIELDERGKICPLPIIALGKAAASASGGTVIGVLSDDAAARYDVPAWCSMRAAIFLGSTDHEDYVEYRIRTAGGNRTDD